MTPQEIDALIAKRDRITTRYGYRTHELDRIDAKLATVPPGQDNRIDRYLGRSCAVLPDPLAGVDWGRIKAELNAERAAMFERETDVRRDIVDALKLAADAAGARAEWLTPREVARLDNAEMERIATDAMQNQPPIEY